MACKGARYEAFQADRITPNHLSEFAADLSHEVICPPNVTIPAHHGSKSDSVMKVENIER